MVGNRSGKTIQPYLSIADQLRQHLSGVLYLESQRLAQDARILVAPGMVAGGAGGHQPPGANCAHRLHVMARQRAHIATHASDLERKAAAPFLAAQCGKALSRPLQNLYKALGHAVYTRVQRSHTAHKVDRLRAYVVVQAFGHFLQVLRPDQSLGVVLTRYVVLASDPGSERVKDSGVEIPLHQLFAHGDPQGAGVDLHRAHHVAASAERTLVDTLPVSLEHLVGSGSNPKEPGQHTEVVCLPEILDAGDLLQGVDLLVSRLGIGGAGFDALTTAGAGLQFHHLAQGEMGQVYFSSASIHG